MTVETAVDERSAEFRLCRLLDEGTLDTLETRDQSGVLAVRGRIDGRPVIAYSTDAAIMGGALGIDGSRKIVHAVNLAAEEGVPVVGLWHSGGARLADGVESMHGVGQMFSAMTRASGRIPQISLVLGPSAGAAAYGPALTDIVVMAPQAALFTTGPEVVRSLTGEQIDIAGLGGPQAHARRSGLAHVVAETEAEAYASVRQLVGLTADPGEIDLGAVQGEGMDLRALLPDRPQSAFDVHPLIHALLDGDFIEFQPLWAPNIVLGLGRLAGRAVGVIANNPLSEGGCLDSVGAEKTARFVRTCDALGIPLVVLVDVPGFRPGIREEWDGVLRRGAKLMHAFAEAVVPRITLVTRKSHGGGYIAMNSRSLGATAVLAWPEAEMAVMTAEAAVAVLHRKRLAATPEADRDQLRAELMQEHDRLAGGLDRALALGVVDEVVSPRSTRRRIAEVLAVQPRTRGRHGNIPL